MLALGASALVRAFVFLVVGAKPFAVEKLLHPAFVGAHLNVVIPRLELRRVLSAALALTLSARSPRPRVEARLGFALPFAFALPLGPRLR